MCQPVCHARRFEHDVLLIRVRRLAEFEARTENKPTAEELDLLRLEVNTWGLLQAIMPSVTILVFVW
jgi:hypothetical protein